MALQTAAITGNIRDFTTGWHNAPINITRTTVNPIPGEETTLAPNFSATFYTDENGDVAFTLPFDDETPTNYELTLPKGGTYANTITGDTTIADWIQSAIQPTPPTGVFVPVQSQGTAIVRADGGIGGDPRGDNAVDLQRARSNDSTVASGGNAVVGGGNGNTASGLNSTVAGGNLNTASNVESTVAGGGGNTASNVESTVAGGGGNIASGVESTVGGGNGNIASGSKSTVGGGSVNTASGDSSIVAGGNNNTAIDDNSVIAGGIFNEASGNSSVVGGGFLNQASGDYSIVAGGRNMQLSATAARSFAVGYSTTAVSFTQPDAFITYGLRPFMSAPNTAVTDADMKDGSISFWIDEVSGLLVFRVKYSDGTLQTGEVPFSKSAIIETISVGRDWTPADNGKVFHFDATLTMNSPDGLPDGWQVALNNLTNTNTVTFTAATTMNGEGGLTTMTGVDFARATLYHEAANVQYLGGNLA